MSSLIKVLVVDDDYDIRELLEDYLGECGFSVALADCAEAMHSQIERETPDIVIMDVGLPGEDGLSLTRYLREHLDIGVLMISGAADTIDRIIGLEVGADDYLAKPFDPRELKIRLKNVLKRYQSHSTEAQSESDVEIRAVGSMRLNLTSRQLHDSDENEIPLTAMEFDLLKTFVERPSRPLTRDQLLNLTQNRDWDPYDRSIDIRITRLRRKLESDPNNPQLIRTVRGVGYMFVPAKSTPKELI